MAVSSVARRYASGLWDYALSVNENEVVVKEVQSIIENIQENRHFQLFLKSPIIETWKKIQITDEIFKSFSATTRHFITLVLKHKRENILLEICQDVINLYDEYEGIQRIEITSSIPLEQGTINKIIASEPSINPEKAIVENIVDLSLIGGYILRMEDLQIDASVKTKLNNIKKKLGEKVF